MSHTITNTDPSTEIRLPDGDVTPDVPSSVWDPSLRTLAAVVAVTDLTYVALTTVIPPLLVLGVLGLLGVVLLGSRAKPARILLLVVSIGGIAGGAAFAVPALAHPESFLDFVHSVSSLPLRLVVGGIAVAALRVSDGPARGVRTAALAVFGVLAAISLIFTFAAGGGAAVTAEDAVIEAQTASFSPSTMTVGAGQRLVIDNTSLIRHTFVLEGNDAINLPPNSATVAELDLEPGTYDYLCDLPGHESMTGTLTVAG